MAIRTAYVREERNRDSGQSGLLRIASEVLAADLQQVLDLDHEDASWTVVAGIRACGELAGIGSDAGGAEGGVLDEHDGQAPAGHVIPIHGPAGDLDAVTDQESLLASIRGVHVKAHVLPCLPGIAPCRFLGLVTIITNIKIKSSELLNTV
jgi:hypothetical protein